MKALVYHGTKDIRYEDHPDPVLHADTDAIVRVSACAICGSDLHIYHGHGFSEDRGYCVGHEAVGEVVEAGRGVRRLRVGDKVMISGSTGCGACTECLAGRLEQCRTGPIGCYGLGKALEGSQAEAVRVPLADHHAVPIPEGVSTTQALLLTDNLPTAWLGCRRAEIAPGDMVAVVGLGPVGLMAVENAFVLGAGAVFAIDPNPDRRAIAATLGAVALGPDDARARIAEATRGLMADRAVEAVGADAPIRLAIDLVGRGCRVSVVGVSQTMDFRFPMAAALNKSLRFSIALCGVPQWWPELVPLLQHGRLRPERFVSHVLPLAQGPAGYDMFDRKADGALKIVLEA